MREPRNYEAPLCAEVGGDLWFPEHTTGVPDIQRAKSICGRCIHRLECAEWGINYERHGIWGGLSAPQREVIRAKRRIRLPREGRSA